MSRRQVTQLDVPAADAELAADLLWRAAPTAVSEVDLGDGRVRLTADVVGEVDAGDLAPGWDLHLVEVDLDAASDGWRAWARPVRAGRGVVVQPTWVEPLPVSEGDVVVHLDAGRAFGSGSHPSTRLALAALEAHLGAGDRMLDVGCGSGVLAVAGVLLGAAAVDAIDIDPVAVEVTQRNAARNGVAGQVAASATPLADVAGAYDLVVANIGQRVLLDLADDLARMVRRDGGLLVLAGLLEPQVEPVVASLAGCAVVACEVEEGWAAPVLRAR